jgi:phosphoribosylformylglycinamidine synthase subunit PurSL
MAQLVRANKALYDVCTAYGVPPISGKDSMKNDSVRGGRKISIPPTVLFSTIAKMDDVRSALTMHFKKAGDAVYVVGLTRNELGASEFHRWLARQQETPAQYGGQVPALDPVRARATYKAMADAAAAGLLASSHTPTLGGLALAFALAAMGGDLGADIDLAAVPSAGLLDDDALLFSESNSRFVVTCAAERGGELERLFSGLAIARVGTVAAERRLKITGPGGRVVVEAEIDDIRRAFRKTLDGI